MVGDGGCLLLVGMLIAVLLGCVMILMTAA